MFYPLFLAHLAADYIFQPYWIVKRKRHWSGLFIHCSIVLLCMLALILFDHTFIKLWKPMLLITLIHLAADRWKVRYGHIIPGPPIVAYLVDQLIHFTTLVLVLYLFIPAREIWSFQATTISHQAFVLMIYVIATFALPISVMVWRDPNFAYARLAVPARIRSFLIGLLLIMLIHLIGPTALLIAALVLAIVIRKPRSLHPLDQPIGVLTAGAITMMLGMFLRVLG